MQGEEGVGGEKETYCVKLLPPNPLTLICLLFFPLSFLFVSVYYSPGLSPTL